MTLQQVQAEQVRRGQDAPAGRAGLPVPRLVVLLVAPQAPEALAAPGRLAAHRGRWGAGTAGDGGRAVRSGEGAPALVSGRTPPARRGLSPAPPAPSSPGWQLLRLRSLPLAVLGAAAAEQFLQPEMPLDVTFLRGGEGRGEGGQRGRG